MPAGKLTSWCPCSCTYTQTLHNRQEQDPGPMVSILVFIFKTDVFDTANGETFSSYIVLWHKIAKNPSAVESIFLFRCLFGYYYSFLFILSFSVSSPPVESPTFLFHTVSQNCHKLLRCTLIP